MRKDTVTKRNIIVAGTAAGSGLNGIGACWRPRATSSRLAGFLDWQYIGIIGQIDDSSMPRAKTKVLTIRSTAEVKALLKLAAEREHRSAASMVEVLVLDYARSHDLAVPDSDQPSRKGANNAK